MLKDTSNRNSDHSPHRCCWSCLGPLSFHFQAVGDMVRLSRGGLQAERRENTFKDGLVFSSRPLKVQERIRLRVEKDSFNWNGGLRLGFTTVHPMARSLPLPIMAIPNLTETPGHWAAPIHESFCQAGVELEFWVSARGTMYISGNNGREQKLLSGVDLSRPLWAMIDIYGQTCSISLLGSEKREFFRTRRSCPAPECLTSTEVDNHCSLMTDSSSLDGNSDEYISCLEGPEDGDASCCVVCMERQASITLPCGHRCLCNQCASKVLKQFGTCPLCRQNIRAPSGNGRRASVRA
ncbi:hypothetical protein JOQ06_012331 [Pogonophryne albipinna]|uniref:E3 ubiquitin-protein ligase NEURL3 n=1 Tax=Pogonophryne albipinna TaxID=1090488 RepID=A0AAD6BF97_9TELE|nr:hypothetical protein JOQ06_012331 [Pogonophryne albipinna]